MDYFIPSTGAVLSAQQVQLNYGVNPNSVDISNLNSFGIYPVNPGTNLYPEYLYEVTPQYTIVGQYAEQTFMATPRPLALAKENASEAEKALSNEQAELLIESSGVNVNVWTGAASQDPASRPPIYNTLLNEMASIGDNLATNLTAIAAATSVDDINNIVNPPSGIISTGRGSGLGPEDLNPSYYTQFNSATLTEADTELYVPGTATVIPYDPGLPPPYIFDSLGDCFNPGNYVIQIRVSATSEVIAEFVVPLNPLSQNVPF